MLLPDRFIPTYVGHTRWYHGCMRASAVHPHIRGAYRVAGSLQKASAGSSPHTWGIHADQPLPGAGRRFIPTYVGHTWADLLKFMSRTVHPHIRGAYSICGRRPAQSAGSSPPTWGIHPEAVVRPTVGRFIPTYVGHTDPMPLRPLRPPVHPHIRGAYPVALHFSPSPLGSSPHTWGIRTMSNGSLHS